MAAPSSRRYAHAEGITRLCFDSQRRVVTCGHDCDVRIMDGDDSTEFSVSSDILSAVVCYPGDDGQDVVAVAMDNHSVQTFKLDGSPEGLLMRFTAPVTYLAVNSNRTLLAAGSSDFIIQVTEIADIAKTFNLIGHEAPVLCVKFDPRGEFLASSSCDGTVKIWSLKSRESVETLSVLQKCNDVSFAKSLCCLAWQPKDGKMLAIPVGTEVKVYDRLSWKCMFSLSDGHHKEAVNVVSWSPCASHLASGGVDGAVCLWDVHTRKVYSKLKNENKIGITSLEWDPRGRSTDNGEQVVFADQEGYVGVFEDVYPSNKPSNSTNDDTLADDSLLMEGIPPDDIFNDFDDGDDDLLGSHDDKGTNDDDDDDSIVQSRKRRRLEINDVTPAPSDFFDDAQSVQSGDRDATPVDRELTNQIAPLPRKVIEFNEKLVQVGHGSLQPSATPDHLQHRFMVYNLVGLVRCHSDDNTSMVEVDFHNTGTHHSFSLSNFAGHSMAALNEQALVLACERAEDQPSQLQCVHFSSWDTNKEWTVSLPAKENCLALTIGDGWIAMATSKQMLRLFMMGGVQREVISLPGHVVTVVGWGGRLAVVYQTGLGTSSAFSLTVWVLDVQRKTQLHPPHSLPLSHHATLEWIGFSEEGVLISYDSKGIVRILSSRYGGLSWIPVLDTNKQLGNKSDHYFLVGMTHNPDELRAILCKGLNYPPVHPKPVMSILQLKLPLCEMNTEKSEIEQQHVQLTMLRPPSSLSEGNAVRIQQLMKLFALACKSDREFRACEIAAMLPDEHSMNLALTYASRTQHLRLARHISDLIQQKSIEGFYSDEEESIPIGQFDAECEEGEDLDRKYAQDRSEKLKQGTRITSKTIQHLKKGISSSTSTGLRKKIALGHSSSRFSSKFSNPANVAKQNEHSNGNNEDTDTEIDKVYNETKELFSDEVDSENEGEGTHERGDDVIDKQEDSPTHTPPYTMSSGTGTEKRHNPFKMATPVSKKVQLDRKSSFLDNISTRVSENKKRKEKVKGSNKMKEKLTKPAGKRNKLTTGSGTGTSGSKNPSMQRSLKGSFFKQKSDGADTNTNVATPHIQQEVENDEKEVDIDGHDSSSACHVDGEDKTLTSKQKLSAFAFKQLDS